jgi:DNA-binding NtrC family response regulator
MRPVHRRSFESSAERNPNLRSDLVAGKTFLGECLTLPGFRPIILVPLPRITGNAMKSATATGSVLLVDDNESFARMLVEAGRQAGCKVYHAANVEAARGLLAEGKIFDLLLVDIMLPDGNGLELVESMDLADQGRIAIVTGMPSVESAVRVLNTPVVDYLVKPIPAATLQELLLGAHDRAVARSRVSRPLGDMVGGSIQMRTLFDQIRQVGPLDVSVLIHGESGTGKELVARALHEQSGRAGRFVPVNCGAITHDLLGSQVFGHERGAFTGAVQSHTGFFEQADGGTLFLDEITEMPAQLQVYLLRVLESRMLTRLGGTREFPVDVRLVAATNRDPRAAVAAGVLRQDLYYRLIEFPLYIHPLRERREDIALLARHFLDRLNRKYGTSKTFQPDALVRMTEAAWPGNVRELRHAVQRHFILSGDSPQVGFRHDDAPVTAESDADSVHFRVGMTFEEVEREMLLKTLSRCGNNKSRTANVLGITAKTIYNRLLRYRAEGLIDDSLLHGGPAEHDSAG